MGYIGIASTELHEGELSGEPLSILFDDLDEYSDGSRWVTAERIEFIKSRFSYLRAKLKGWIEWSDRQQKELYVWHTLYGCPVMDENSDFLCLCGRRDRNVIDPLLGRHGGEIDNE